eukprot:256603_1
MVQLLKVFALCLVLTSLVLAQYDIVLDDVPVVYYAGDALAILEDDDQKSGMGGDDQKKDDKPKDGDQPAMGGDDQKKGGDDQPKDDKKKDDGGSIRIRNPFVTGAAPTHTVGGMVLTLTVLSAASLYL